MHFVTEYAKSVLRRKDPVIAGPHVRAACRRHLKDLKTGKERGLYFDESKANRIIEFANEVCFLNGGDYEGVPFDPLPWQRFILGSLFGWVKADGTRRFRVAFIETSKGSGKSPLAALIGIYGLIADNEPRAEIYAAATKKDQAMVLFRDAVAMVKQSPYLEPRIKTSGTGANVWNLAYLEAGAFFRPIASDNAQSGPRPHIVLLDEIHEHKNDNVIEMMRAGTKGRRQALIFMITNSGHDKHSVCYNYHKYGIKVANGAIIDDSFFSYVCALDKGDDPFLSEDCWGKTNPSLGVTIQPEYIREQVTQAKGMPSKESVVRRLNFSEWVGSANPWLSFDLWNSAGDDNYPDLTGRKCYGGLDLSSVHDLTALVLAFEPTDIDPVWRLLPFFWLPEEGLLEKGRKDGVDYLSWVKDGFLMATPGNAIDKRYICKELMRISSIYNIIVVGYDKWRIEDLMMYLDNEGANINMSGYEQTFKAMFPGVDEFERRLLTKKLKHNNNPIMTWCAANTVIASDHANNRKPVKEKGGGKIDGVIAGVMAIGSSIGKQIPKSNIDFFLNNQIYS